MAHAHDRVGRFGHLEQGETSAGSHHPTELGDRGGQVGEVASANPQVAPSSAPSGNGSATPSAWARGTGRSRGQHPEAEVRRSAPPDRGRHLGGQVTGPGGQVEHPGPWRQSEHVQRPSTPPDVHPERHHPVHQVVAGCDRVEHGPHRRPSCRPRSAAAGRAGDQVGGTSRGCHRRHYGAGIRPSHRQQAPAHQRGPGGPGGGEHLGVPTHRPCPSTLAVLSSKNRT